MEEKMGDCMDHVLDASFLFQIRKTGRVLRRWVVRGGYCVAGEDFGGLTRDISVNMHVVICEFTSEYWYETRIVISLLRSWVQPSAIDRVQSED